MPPVGSETTISAGERPQTYALDRAATGTSGRIFSLNKSKIIGEKRGINWVIRVLNYVNDRFKAHHPKVVKYSAVNSDSALLSNCNPTHFL